jgi:hypothetical protein
MSYKVLVDDNAHYMDESARYTLGEFASAAEALAAARAVVEDDLKELYRPGMSAAELFRHYTTFGRDPFIVSNDPDCTFSAWDYARTRSQELCGGG